MKQRIFNWVLNKYLLEKKKAIDEEYQKNIEEIKLLFDKRTLREVLWEMMFPSDIAKPINRRERYQIYAKLNADTDYIKLFKSKYSKNYLAYIQALDDEQRNIIKGRMAELQDTLTTMATAKDILNNWEQVEMIQDKKLTLKKDIQEQILITNEHDNGKQQ